MTNIEEAKKDAIRMASTSKTEWTKNLAECFLALLKECEEKTLVIEHALALGYLGEGSTQGLAREVLEKYNKERCIHEFVWENNKRECLKCGVFADNSELNHGI